MKRYSTVFSMIILVLAVLASGCAVMQGTHTLSSKPVDAEPEPEYTPEPAMDPEEPRIEMVPAPKPEAEPEPEEMSFDEEEALAIQAAKDFVESLEGFKDQKGRDLQIKSTVKTGCEGCWIVELTFIRADKYYPDKTEKIRANVKLKDFKMDSYTFG